MNKKLRVAVTGGIGSGKSTFAGYLEQMGYPVLKADDISKEILSTNDSIRKKVIKAFGEESFKGGTLNKRFLASKVFSDPLNVVRINAILHPPVIKKLEQEMDEQLKSNDVVFTEAALIYEADMEKMFDYIILITAAETVRMERKTLQEKISAEDFNKRSLNQIPDEEKKKRADFIFENNGTPEELKKKAELLVMLLKSI